MGRLLSLFIALAAVGCELATAPLPPGAVAFNAPSVYQRWWALTEQCSGLSGDFSRIRWYLVPGASEIARRDAGSLAGLAYPSQGRIVLAGNDVFFGDLVRHEMLHALLGADVSGHPRDMFIRRCQGVVVCVDACVSDAGPAPDPDPAAIHVPQDDVTVTFSIDPPGPSRAVDQGAFTMIITATNTMGVPIIADQSQCFLCSLRTFSFRGQRTDSSGVVNYDEYEDYPEQRRFAAGESKIFIYDFRIGPGDSRYDIAPGTWNFSGAYGGRWTLATPVVVAQ